jgi:N-acetylmuramoyl-L-alanine amidase
MCPVLRVVRIGIVVLAALVLWAGPWTGDVLAEPVASEARTGVHTDQTRFVLELSEKVEFRVFALADPFRVVIDLPRVEFKLPANAHVAGVGLIKGFRYGLYRPGTSRIVLDVDGPVAIRKSFLLPPRGNYPYRFILDLEPSTREALAKRRRLPPLAARATLAPPLNPSLKPQKKRQGANRKKLIVVDPGHGGVDPGTLSVSGVREKDITLAMAREVKRRFEASGRYRVVLTRKTDVFLRLRERIIIARDIGADLFMSLHADSLRNHKVRGASVYTLSETASDKEAGRLAAKENKADIIAGEDLSGHDAEVAHILIDLTQRETMNTSVRFAKVLVKEMGRAIRLLRNTHRFAGFAVLKAPDIPSVLVEMGYLSNRQDERLLRSPKHRAKIANAMILAVDRFFAEVPI